MKISELLELLKEPLERYGDLEVYVENIEQKKLYNFGTFQRCHPGFGPDIIMLSYCDDRPIDPCKGWVESEEK